MTILQAGNFGVTILQMGRSIFLQFRGDDDSGGKVWDDKSSGGKV